MNGGARIAAINASTFRIPTDAPEADGTFHWDATEMVVVEAHSEGVVGMGYSYTAAHAAAALVRETLAPGIVGENAFDLSDHWLQMNRALRNIGREGVGSMAMAATDQALWDLKAKLLGISLTVLWGACHLKVPLYGSGGFTTYTAERLQDQLGGWVRQGFNAVKMKLSGIVEEDIARVAAARAAIGDSVKLMVDANGAYTPRTALALCDQLQDSKVCWFEEPVSSDDLAGLRWLRDRSPAPMAIAAGEYGWDGLYFQRMLTAGAVDVLQADVTRCGYTGFFQAALLSSIHQIPISAHCAPAAHAAICAAVPHLIHLEYFHDHARIEAMLFDGYPKVQDGWLRPDRERPGHGLKLRADAAEDYRF